MNVISYSKIVFGLKHHQQFYDCREVNELVRSLRIIISVHDAATDVCERPGMHYHGIIEHGKDMHDGDAIAYLRTYCEYFNIEKCQNPKQLVADLAQPPKMIMIIEIANSINLKYYYSAVMYACNRIGLGVYDKEVSKMEAIKFIISKITTRKTFEEADIGPQIKNCYNYPPDELETLITHSVDLVHQKMLNQSILELCGRFLGTSVNYYTIQESTDLVKEWCRFQNIDVEELTINLVKCLDRQVWYKNSLYFQGSSESGIINIINSIAEACAFIGKINSETTGYSYVWEDCVEKRCIIMQDPIFDETMFEELENILRGVGTIVPHRQNILKYMRPTPVIVICCENDNDMYIRRLQTCFIESYSSLKPFVKFMNDPRQLHPDWLYVMYMFITEHKIDYTASFCKDNYGGSMDSDSSCEMNEEFSMNSPDEPVSSTTPFSGYSSSS